MKWRGCGYYLILCEQTPHCDRFSLSFCLFFFFLVSGKVNGRSSNTHSTHHIYNNNIDIYMYILEDLYVFFLQLLTKQSKHPINPAAELLHCG